MKQPNRHKVHHQIAWELRWHEVQTLSALAAMSVLDFFQVHLDHSLAREGGFISIALYLRLMQKLSPRHFTIMPPFFRAKRSFLASPLDNTDISLDISGVAGFFGGDVAVSAMTTVHMYDARKYLGWYNTPGSYEIARRYGQVARSRFWDGLYPGVNLDPAVLFELDGLDGPRYRGIQSGTIMRKTGQTGLLFVRECDAVEPEKWTPPPDARTTAPVDVTIAHLQGTHRPEQLTKEEALFTSVLLALIPILSSAATAAMCAVFNDWICFAMIVLGMTTSGVSCWVIGTGQLAFSFPDPIGGSPPTCGILDDKDHFVVLKGPKTAIRAITRGKFSLEYPGTKRFHELGMSSLMLTVQFLAQLLIVPQGTIFGQIMFLTSLGVSWVYNSYLSSLDHEKLQRRILFRKVLDRPVLRKYTLGTRTTMGVFVLLLLASDGGSSPTGAPGTPGSSPHSPEDTQAAASLAAAHGRSLSEERVIKDRLTADEGFDDLDTGFDPSHDDDEPSPPDSRALRDVLDDILPNDTPVWRFWKDTFLEQLPGLLRGAPFRPIQPPGPMSKDRRILLRNLYKDIEAAVTAFRAYEASVLLLSLSSWPSNHRYFRTLPK